MPAWPPPGIGFRRRTTGDAPRGYDDAPLLGMGWGEVGAWAADALLPLPKWGRSQRGPSATSVRIAANAAGPSNVVHSDLGSTVSC
jgi:hypothetical protein